MRLLTAYFVGSFYVLGALIIENDVHYVTWYQIGSTHFRAYHQALESRLQVFLFTPMAIQLLLNGWLVWRRPTGLPRWPFVVTGLLYGYVVVESLLVQVPLHRALASQYSVELLDQLIASHRVGRLPAELLAGSLTGWILYQSLTKK